MTLSNTSTLDALGPGGLLAVSGSMTGAGGININSSGTAGGVVAFGGIAKTYSGATTINPGATLVIINSSMPNSNIVLNGGTLRAEATADPGSGGTQSSANGDWIHTFNTAGTTSQSYSFATSTPLNAQVLLVAGGGGGAGGYGGGGGAGGLVYSPSFSIGIGTTAGTVGGGGAGGGSTVRTCPLRAAAQPLAH